MLRVAVVCIGTAHIGAALELVAVCEYSIQNIYGYISIKVIDSGSMEIHLVIQKAKIKVVGL